jgi:glycosyltransferase involved in cell wall biosynthesis
VKNKERPLGSSVLKRVSVIVPTYMRAQELDTLLFPSLAKQTVLPFETIVIDDTPDKSVETVCAKWKNRNNSIPRLLYRRNTSKRSLTVARNYGVTEARGDFLMFLDSDLMLDSGYVEAILAIFSLDSKAAGVQGYISNISNHPQVKRVIRQKKKLTGVYPIVSIFLRNFAGIHMPSNNSCRMFEYPVLLDRTINCDWLSGSNFTVPRNFFNYALFDSELKGYSLGEDVIFSSYLKLFGNIYITPFARCEHLDAKSGDSSRGELEAQERLFFLKKFGMKGWFLFFNKLTLMKLAKVLRI